MADPYKSFLRTAAPAGFFSQRRPLLFDDFGSLGEGVESKKECALLKKGAPKTFVTFTWAVETSPGERLAKVFWFFFSKKERLAFLYLFYPIAPFDGSLHLQARLR
jgi:hypothetical protein